MTRMTENGSHREKDCVLEGKVHWGGHECGRGQCFCGDLELCAEAGGRDMPRMFQPYEAGWRVCDLPVLWLVKVRSRIG